MPLLRFDVHVHFADGPDWVCDDVEARNESEARADCLGYAREAGLEPSGATVKPHRRSRGSRFTMLDLDRALGLS